MNTIKIFTAALIISAFSIFVGCSDESFSPTSQSLTAEKTAGANAGDNINANIYHSLISLKPGQLYTFNYSNTGFYIFNSVQILNCESVKGRIEVSGQIANQALILGCNSKGFKLSKITVINQGLNVVDLDIFLSGSKEKITDPYEIDSKLF